MTEVESTNFFHNLGFKGVDIKALVSKYSMNKLTILADKGEPIATPQFFSYTSPMKLKKLDLRHISISFGVSQSIILWTTSIIPSIGILVYSEVTQNLLKCNFYQV